MTRHRIIALALVGIISITALGSTRSDDDATPERAALLAETRSGDQAEATPSTSEVTPSTTEATEPVAVGTETTPSSVQPSEGDDGIDVPAAPVRASLPGAGGPPPTSPPGPIGDLDDDRPVPAGFDFTAPPEAHGTAHDFGGPTDLAVEPSCSHQCITSGVAYPRGFGAELVVTTSVPAQLFITAIADLDDDGEYEDLHVESPPFAVTEHSWALDHLAPGETYHVMAAATDQDGHTAYVWGEFTTLAQRTVFVEIGDTEIVGGPGNISHTQLLLGLAGPLVDVTPGQQGILLYKDQPRHVDLDLWVLRSWDDKLCETWTPAGSSAPHGHESAGCVTWNSTSVDAVDLDQAPPGQTRWTATSVTTLLQPPTGAGDALPPGYGDPYYFSFEVPVTLHVTYS